MEHLPWAWVVGLPRMSMWVAEEGETIDSFMDATLREVGFKSTGREVTVARNKLIQCSPLVIKEVVRRSMIGLGVHYGPCSRHLTVALEFIRDAVSGRRLDLPEGVVIGRDFDELFLTRRSSGVMVGEGPPLEIEMSRGWSGEIKSCGGAWRVLVDISPAAEIDEYKGTAFHQYFDLGDVVMPVRARRWRYGDSLAVFGMRGRKKVSDLLVDERVPLRNRDDVLVLEDGRSILWVIGVRRGSRGRVAGGRGKIASISFESLQRGEGLNLAR